MTAPIHYLPNFIPASDTCFQTLWEELDWVRHDKVPRREYYSNDFNVPYTYGTEPFARTYEVQPWHPLMKIIRTSVELATGEKYETCFINGYEDDKDQLGWHADDSPEMDDNRAIVIISLGAEREIWFQDNAKREEITKIRLGNGSICVMQPGMQDDYKHRIPKSDRECGPRLSLTFRGFVV